jgi:DnaJ-domain-containing protein 1
VSSVALWIRHLPTNQQTGSRHVPPDGAVSDPDQEDYYSLLGVPFTATHADIDRAYRRAMMRAHPDRVHPERRAAAEDLARRMNAAYATLSDPIKRLAYDRTIRQQVIQDQIMRRYVGGFQTFDGADGPARAHAQRMPTATERQERSVADRKASLLLLLVAVGITALIVAAIVVLAVLGSLLGTLR